MVCEGNRANKKLAHATGLFAKVYIGQPISGKTISKLLPANSSSIAIGVNVFFILVLKSIAKIYKVVLDGSLLSSGIFDKSVIFSFLIFVTNNISTIKKTKKINSEIIG